MPSRTRTAQSTGQTVIQEWEKAWPKALSLWSRYTRLRPPRLCLTRQEAFTEGLRDSFAMIRLSDQSIIVSLPELEVSNVQNFPLEILAHEIGHHILAPATLTDHARMISRMRWALPTIENQAPMVANLYTDILINDRLQRSCGLRLAEVYQKIGHGGGGTIWTLYMRIYEILWSRERGSLGGGQTDDRIEGDAHLGARLIRSYARDWLEGSGRFAALLLPHLLEDQNSRPMISRLMDTEQAAAGGVISGLTEEDPDERRGAIHPSADPLLNDTYIDDPQAQEPENQKEIGDPGQNSASRGQLREPFQYGEILRSAGLNISDHDAAVHYYRERAARYLIPFPCRKRPEGSDPLPEGLEPWDIGDALDNADWFQSILQSPRIIPGMTTVQRVWGSAEGPEQSRIPLDLDLYVDSSGSMPNPQRMISYPALAGAILCLSALRAGARVQVTLWSGTREFLTTDGFVRDEIKILKVLTGFFGGCTAFPIHILRDTYKNRPPGSRPAHIMVISDDGVTTLFDPDEHKQSGWQIAAQALEKAGGGGSFVLNLYYDYEKGGGESAKILKARDKQGWQIYPVKSLEELVDFAKAFSRHHYQEKTDRGDRSEGVRR